MLTIQVPYASFYCFHEVSGKKNEILRFMRKSYRKFQKDDATRYQTQLRKTVGGETTVCHLSIMICQPCYELRLTLT